MHKKIPANQAALEVVERLVKAGHTAYWAGGCVRDLLLEREPKDYDVATSAIPDEIVLLFKRTRKVGMHFGVVIVGIHQHWIEVATFRTDASYSDGRRPDAVTFSTPEEDAKRRDFTINGMFYEPTEARIIDFVDGQADLKAGIIRAIGDPDQRIQEDRLRMLRAIRFAARMNFQIDPDTYRVIKANAARLGDVSVERIREELEMLLADVNRQRGFDLLVQTGLLAAVFPGCRFEPAHLDRCHRLLGELPERGSYELPLAILLSGDKPSAVNRIARRLTMSNPSREQVVWLVEHQFSLNDPSGLSLADLKRLLAHRCFEDLWTWLHACARLDASLAGAIDEIRRRRDDIPLDHVAPPPLLTGEHLLNMQVPAGPVYKCVLDAVYTAQLNEEIDSEAKAIALAERLLADAAAGP